MLRCISIQGVKSFPKDKAISVVLDHNKRVSLFYGLNGSGKSAIAQVIHRNGTKLNPFTECALTYTGQQDSYLHLVYDEDFVDKNFRSQQGFPGIFSIGQQDNEALREAEEKQKKSDELEQKRETLLAQKAQQYNELESALNDASDATWPIWTSYKDGALKACVTGVGNNKRKLFEKLQGIALADGEAIPSIDQLTSRIKDVDATEVSEKDAVSLDLSGLKNLELSSVWAEPIVGSSDSKLAALIQQLGNIDWVKQGEKYLPHDAGTCPFCQQRLPHEFKAELGKLIDDNYRRRVAAVVDAHDRYAKAVQLLAAGWQKLISDEPLAKEHPSIEALWGRLELALSRNLASMHQKVLVPSAPVAVDSSEEAATALADAIAQVNERITQFNTRIRNRRTEADRIKVDFWKRMRQDHAGTVNVYVATSKRLNAVISDINAELESLRSKLTVIATRLAELRANSIGTQQSVDAINRRLHSLGIDAFKIKKKSGPGNFYCLERPGIPVEDYRSLSEGEKTLISFFYFVELVNGSAAQETHYAQDKKIVVIDDPISSLSHNYVYDIASIIANEIVNGGKKVRQVIVLTHSLFFHHELIKQIDNAGISQYFRVLKRDCSDVIRMKGDEILNDYQAFWRVLKDAREGNASVACVPNAMRCIFEHFFSFTEERENFRHALRELGEEDHTFTPLGRFLDNRSHADNVNLTDFGELDINYYIDKFQAVFERTNYRDHFTKMMGI